MAVNSDKEKNEVRKQKYGQPARKIADDENPVTLGEEEGSVVAERNSRKSHESKDPNWKN